MSAHIDPKRPHEPAFTTEPEQLDRAAEILPLRGPALSEEDGQTAYSESAQSIGSIGSLLVASGKLTPAQADRILKLQKDVGIRFGEAAIKLKLVTQDDIRFALSRQHRYDYVRPGESSVAREVRCAYEPFGKQAEAMRGLRSQILLRALTGKGDTHCLALVSPDARDGRSYMLASLAVVFAQNGDRTLVVDADLRKPRQHELFGVDNKLGLASILADRCPDVVLSKVPGMANLTVLPAGPIPPNPLELLGSQAFVSLLSDLRSSYDVVLIDTPSSAAYADAQVVAARAGSALLVLRRNNSRLEQAESLRSGLTTLGSCYSIGRGPHRQSYAWGTPGCPGVLRSSIRFSS